MKAVLEHPLLDTAKADAVLTTMRAAGAAGPGARITRLEQLQGGWSRHSYVAHLDHGDEEQVYIVRVRPSGSLLDTDLEEEFRILRLLVDAPLPTPAVHGFESSATTPFDGPFFVMDRLDGRAVNVWRKRDRAELSADWDGTRGVATDFVDHLAAIHRVDVDQAHGPITTRDYVATIDHWHGVYQRVRLVRDPVIDEAYAWVRDREPDPVAPALVHGDYRIGNCLIDGGRISGILDWELAFVGDPRFDLGYVDLAYYAGKLTTPGSSRVNAVADRAWFHQRYEQQSGRPVDGEVVRTFSVLGALMLFTIMTTGLRVYAEGATTDIRLAWSRFALPGLRQDLAVLMDW